MEEVSGISEWAHQEKQIIQTESHSRQEERNKLKETLKTQHDISGSRNNSDSGISGGGGSSDNLSIDDFESVSENQCEENVIPAMNWICTL